MTGLGNLQRHFMIAATFVALMAVVPFVITERYLLGQVIVFMIWTGVALQWNVLTGHAGVFSLAQMLFFAIGAYGLAMMGTYLGMSAWAGMPLAAILAAIAALFIGLACLRLATAYIALLTFAITNMVASLIITDSACYAQILGSCQPFFGGSNGFSQFPELGFRPLLKGNWILGNYYTVLTVLTICLVASIAVIHGRLGLAFRALSNSAVYASARGIDRTKFRLIAFVVTAFFTGLMGAVYAAHFKFAGPSLFDFSTLLFVLSIVIVGGLRSTWGPVVGAALMMMLDELAKGFGDIRNTIIGLALVIFVVLLPRGIAGASSRILTLKRGRLGSPSNRGNKAQDRVPSVGNEKAVSVDVP